MLSLFKTKQTPAAPVATPADAADPFVPIEILHPHQTSLELLYSSVDDVGKRVEFAFPLSSVPHKQWLLMFGRVWQTFYPTAAFPFVASTNLFVTATPGELASQLQIARAVVEWTNGLAAPLIRGEAATLAAQKKQNDALSEFMYAGWELPDVGKPMILDADDHARIHAGRVAFAERERAAAEKQLKQRLAREGIEDAIRGLRSA